MAQKLCMPKLGATMEQGLIVGWYKQEGETVREGEFLVEVLTKKATFKVQSPVTGSVYRVLAAAGRSAGVGLPLAVLAEEGDEEAVLRGAAAEAEQLWAGWAAAAEVYACPVGAHG